MTNAKKLKICNRTLLCLLLLTLASGIQLEATGSRGYLPVVLHVIISLLFMGLCLVHIYLHFSWGRWLIKFGKLKSVVTRILWWVFAATLISGLIALIHWLCTFAHSPIGAVHGKIGFLMIALATGHTIKRFAYFTPR